VLGGVLETRRLYHNRYVDERRYVEERIRPNPRFYNVEISERSNGGVVLSGTVATDAVLADLRSKVTDAIGATRAEAATRSVRALKSGIGSE
jgi:hypothetical protein